MSKKSYELKQLNGGATLAVSLNDLTSHRKSKEETNGSFGDLELMSSKPKSRRGQWSKGPEFLLSCISMSVGLGNVWRFPDVAYRNGGGAFLVPYLLLLCIIGRPIYYMELIMGQFSGQGPVKAWNCVPALRGIGFAQVASNSYIAIFYNYLMALALYYMFCSFQSPLPWTVCDSSWSNNCGNDTTSTYRNGSYLTQDFWKNHVLKQSSGLNEITYINWKLLLCLAGSWTLVFLSISRGVKSLGKVSYFTALFPYVILIALLMAALTTEGALEGIKYFFEPKWEKLLDPIVWYNAVQQSFFSLTVCFGAITMYSSYNDFRNDVYKDAIIISILDTFTSILAGSVIFAVLGSMAVQANVPIEKVVHVEGLALAFVVYPEALSKLQVFPQLWSILFFVMLFTLGIGSSVAQIETVLTSIKDEFTGLNKSKGTLALVACLTFFALGAPLTTNAGIYMMQLLDNYGVGTAAFLYGIIELTGITWIYGLNRFCGDVRFMLGRSVNIFWRITWCFTAPLSLIIIFTYGNYQIINTVKEEKSSSNDGIPLWGSAIGWALAALALFQIPLWLALTVIQTPGNLRQKIIHAFKPSLDWGPSDPVTRQEWIKWRESREKPLPATYHINTAFIDENLV